MSPHYSSANLQRKRTPNPVPNHPISSTNPPPTQLGLDVHKNLGGVRSYDEAEALVLRIHSLDLGSKF